MRKKQVKNNCKSPDFHRCGDIRELSVYLLPLILTGFFQQFYGLVNTAVMSRTISVRAISVMGACAACSSMQSFIATGMTTGFSMYLTRCYGTGDETLYRRSFTTSLVFLGILTAACIVFMPGGVFVLQRLLNMPEELRETSTWYLRLLILGTGVLGMKNLLLRMLEGMGKSGTSGMVTSCSVVSHTLLLLFCIFVLRMEVSAAALAMLLNHTALSLFLFCYIRKRYPKLTAFELPSEKTKRKEIWKELLSNGGSKSSMMILVGLGNFVMQYAINGLSADQIAAYTYADSLSNFLMVPLSALATAAIASAGQNMGRKDYPQIHLYHKKLMKAHWWCCGGTILLTFCFGREMIALLAGKNAAETVLLDGTKWLYICIPAFLGLGAAMICRNSLQVMGCYRKLIFLGLIEMGITVLFALCVVPGGGYTAVCLSISMKWSAIGIAAVVWYRRRILELL